MALSDISTKRSANSLNVSECVILTDNRSTRLQKERNKQQIKEHGKVHTAIKGYFNSELKKFVVTSGRTRVMNLLELISEGADVSPILKVESVPAPKTPEDHAELLVQEVTDNDSEEFLPIDCARIAQTLKETYSWNNTQIAAKLGRSVADIGQILRLLEQPEEIQEMIQDNEISATLATQIIQKHGEDASEVITAIVENARTEGKKATQKHLKKHETSAETTETPVKISKAKKIETLAKALFDKFEIDEEDEKNDKITLTLNKSQLDEFLAAIR